jgi:hypothetical protein
VVVSKPALLPTTIRADSEVAGGEGGEWGAGGAGREGRRGGGSSSCLRGEWKRSPPFTS